MIELRDAHFSDYAAIAKLHAQSWQQYYRSIFSDQFLDNEVEQFMMEGWQKKLGTENKDQRVTIAVLDDEIAGFSCFLLNDDPVFGSLLDNLHVSKNQQQKGVGKRLMKNCAAIISKEAANNKMYLWVFDLNNNAKAAYERLGGTKFETIETDNADGSKAQTCRYIWNDILAILQEKG